MNLQEAIEHCKEKIDCTECGQEHKQLVEWLEELSFRRSNELYNLGDYFEIHNLPFVITHIRNEDSDIFYTLDRVDSEVASKKEWEIVFSGSVLKNFTRLSKERINYYGSTGSN